MTALRASSSRHWRAGLLSLRPTDALTLSHGSAAPVPIEIAKSYCVRFESVQMYQPPLSWRAFFMIAAAA
jgi:hypothetical protein